MTSPRSAFKLGQELAIAHEQSASGAITVIPVVVDDLGSVAPILKALCDVAEGRLFEASDEALQAPVPSTTDVVRRAAVETALSTADGPGGRRIVLFSAEQGQIDAGFDPLEGAEPSAGERAVLAIARAIVHREFDDRELVVVSYSESGIDYPLRRCLWSLAVHHLARLPHATLRTVVFVTEAVIDIDLHCQEDGGFRFALQESRLLSRHGSADLRVQARRIVTHPNPVVLFLGAGFAVSSRFPLGNVMRDDAIRRLLTIPDTEMVSPEELGRRFHRWVSTKEGWLTEGERAMREDDFARHLTLEQVIRIERKALPNLPTLQAFRAHHDEVIETPGSAVLDLCRAVPQMIGRVVIVEVNFDRLIERHSTAAIRVFSSDDQFEDAANYLSEYLAGNETDVPVLKLHGSIEVPESCVVSDEQQQQGIGRGKQAALDRLVGTREQPVMWVYVGASMRDKDLLPVLGLQQFAQGTEERWVSPYLDASVELFASVRARSLEEDERRWIADRLVTETADSFFRALLTELS